jgi:hypothetical protein
VTGNSKEIGDGAEAAVIHHPSMNWASEYEFTARIP